MGLTDHRTNFQPHSGIAFPKQRLSQLIRSSRLWAASAPATTCGPDGLAPRVQFTLPTINVRVAAPKSTASGCMSHRGIAFLLMSIAGAEEVSCERPVGR